MGYGESAYNLGTSILWEKKIYMPIQKNFVGKKLQKQRCQNNK